MAKTTGFKYKKSFDAMRGFGCLLILVAHGSYEKMKGAWIALDLFFILSGYLITSLLLNEYLNTGDISFKGFYWRRALKILPPLFLCILLANILWPYTTFDPEANRALATSGALFYFINFLQVKITGNMLHLWSLSVEEHFYLFWPLLMLFFIPKISYRNRIWFLGILLFIVAVIRIIIFNYHFSTQFFVIDSYRSTFCRIDTISLGVLLAFITNKGSTKLSTVSDSIVSWFILLILCIYAVIIFTVSGIDPYLNNGGFIFTNLLSVFTILLAIEKPGHYLFGNKALQWIGKRSYGLYLYHIPVFLALEQFRQPHNIVSMLFISLLRVSISILLAVLSFKYIEQPILSYKKRFGEKRIKKPHLEIDGNELIPAGTATNVDR